MSNVLGIDVGKAEIMVALLIDNKLHFAQCYYWLPSNCQKNINHNQIYHHYY